MARRRYGSRRKKRGIGLFLFLFLLIAAGAGAFYVYTSPKFEKTPPKIELAPKIYTNAKTPIDITISDNSAIKRAKVFVLSGGNEVVIYDQSFLLPQNKKRLKINIPQELLKNSNTMELYVEVRDSSLWNFFSGNKALAKTTLLIDKNPPTITLFAKSPAIWKGGVALAIAKVDDEDLDKVFIQVNKDLYFQPIKYKNENVYASLFVWPFNVENFKAKIVAIDKAGNKAEHFIDLPTRYKKYRVSKIEARDKFIDGKIKNLALQDHDYANITDRIERFKAVNELMRKKNEDYIHTISKKVTPFEGTWDIKAFHPLRRAKKVADFGDHRFYYYKNPDNIISTSYHLGLDLASVKNDNIYSSNKGVVVSTKYNGIYGNMPLIDHHFGLYTLYGHCSNVLVKKGQKVYPGEVIAKTGKTGLALGDHLHFGILVQGVEVNPYEWLSQKWIKEYILDIFNKADKIIGYNK